MNLSLAYDLSKAKSRLGRAIISIRSETYDWIVSCLLPVFGEKTNIYVKMQM
jgi:hypothetical protein